MKVLSANKQKLLPIKIRRIKSIAEKIMRLAGSPENAELSLTFCDDAFIQVLNRDFRKKDQPTDVLSFPIDKEPFEAETRVLGDIVISVETAVRQAQELGHTLELEIVILLIHGLLHLHGFDHIKAADRKVMSEKESAVFDHLKDEGLLDSFDKDAATLIKRSVTRK